VDELGDGQLIAAIVGRDPAALAVLYDRHGRLAFGLAYRILGDPGAAEEATQDAFMQVWRRAETFDPGRGAPVRSWLMTIVHHRAIDLLRSRSGREARHTPLEDVEARLSVPDQSASVLSGIEGARVRSAVSTLPVDQRQAIELAWFAGLSHGEIADRIGAPLGTVKGRMRLGLSKLATLLAEPP
jgi:RNA polymerase sigma-70 factor, ECF subfamily